MPIFVLIVLASFDIPEKCKTYSCKSRYKKIKGLSLYSMKKRNEDIREMDILRGELFLIISMRFNFKERKR